MLYGADADELDRLAAEFVRAAEELDGEGNAITRLLNNIAWLGDVAENFFSGWTGVHLPRIGLSANALREASRGLTANAAQQREVSNADGRPTRFVDSGSARADVIEAFWATADPTRAAGNQIEVRRLDNGRYVVVLPGVVDLTDHLGELPGAFARGDAVGPFYDGDQPDTARRMAYAIVEAHDGGDTFANPYATQVAEAMRRAGVPPGADVMLVGHSFGAYTAMELAGDPTFNSADPNAAGYHVNVTHVLAAGGDTNWKFPEIPARTSALVVNNRYDPVFQAEDPLMRDVAPRRPNQISIEYQGAMPTSLGALKDAHKPDTYVKFLTEAHDRPALNAWLDGAGSMYGGAGERFSLDVPDPLRSPSPSN
ncbi:MAG: hypothetical protein QM733_05465 [Ilumatobacteraceae bacterium]